MLRPSPRSLLTLVLAGCAGIPAALAADIDGDGIDDLVIGAPGARVGTVTGGVVDVLYGDGTGLVATGADHLHQDEAGVDDAAETDDDFGRAVGAGDMDGDGYADLVVGVQGEDIDGVLSVGMVHVLYGSSIGAAGVGSDSFILDDLGVEAAGSTAGFGVAIAMGDFDGDGYDDAAIAADRATVGGLWGVGTVYVLYGSRTGPSAADTLSLAQGTDGAPGSVNYGNGFGTSLAVGDFDGDGYADLAVGNPNYSTTTAPGSGAVFVFFGDTGGLFPSDAVLLQQGVNGVPDTSESYDNFGAALAVGDFDADGRDDLAVSAPKEEFGATSDVGAVTVLFGSSAGPTGAGAQRLYQGSAGGLGDSGELGDQLGNALVAGDFNADGHDDLAIAVKYEDVGAVVDAGMVQVVSGGSSGLSGVQSWYQGSSIGGAPGYQDWFGWALAAGDYDGDGHGDLAIGVPYESGSGGDVVHLLYGARGGLSATGSESWDRDDSGVPGANSDFGAWGYALR